jgi:hypothetical protein
MLHFASSCFFHAVWTSLVILSIYTPLSEAFRISCAYLLMLIFIFCVVASGKCASEGNSEPSHKRTAIDLQIKIRMIHKYKGWKRRMLSCGMLCPVALIKTDISEDCITSIINNRHV